MDYPFRRQDIYAAIILIVLALFVIVESWRMPREFLGFPAYAGPGLVTGLLGLGLLGMAVALLMRACRRPGAAVSISRSDIRGYLGNPQTRRFGLVLLLCAAYLLSLGRGVPYYFTTGAYLFITMAAFPGGLLVGDRSGERTCNHRSNRRLQQDLPGPAALRS